MTLSFAAQSTLYHLKQLIVNLFPAELPTATSKEEESETAILRVIVR
jgi:hypothetical protein